MSGDTAMNPPVFVTLGPAGTNHDQVTRTYLAFRDLAASPVLFVEDFDDALALVDHGDADYILICGVHPQCAATVGKGSFAHGIHVMDVFISPSQPLAIVSRIGIEAPRSLALQPATESYTDLSAWPEKVYEGSILAVAEGLLAGRWDSGITLLKIAEENPDRLRVDRPIGSPDDPWLVLGKTRISNGAIIAWPEAPIRRVLKGSP